MSRKKIFMTIADGIYKSFVGVLQVPWKWA